MRFSPLLPAALLLAACGGGSDGPTDPPPAPDLTCATVTPRVLAMQTGPSFAIADAQPNAAAGSAFVQIAGDFPRTINGRAGALESAAAPGLSFTTIDAYAVDTNQVPTAELFIFATSAATVRSLPITPVTLTQLHDPRFVPSGSIAVYAEQYDPAVQDYTRWLIGQAGTISITGADTGRVGRVRLDVTLAGEWVDRSSKSLGCGTIARGHIDAPLVRFVTANGALRDTLTSDIDGGRADTLRTGALVGFQVLEPSRQRLLVTGSAAGDSTKELWLSMASVPAGGDSIALGAPTLDEAMAGRASTSFGMVRVIPSTQSTSAQLWRSTGGYVALTNVVQIGPLALCGWASGRYAFDATGVDLADTTTSLGTLTASGAFESRFTVLALGDTIAGAAVRASGSDLVHPAALAPGSGPSCPFAGAS